MRKHVPHRTGPLALVRGKHVIELQRTGEKHGHHVTGRAVWQLSYRPSQGGQGQQLPLVEEFMPISVTVIENLPRISPVADRDAWHRRVPFC